MERRKFLIGAGSLAAGSAAAVGTGAFTSVQADRTINVEVTGDASALLAITPAETGGDDTPNAEEYVSGGGTSGTVSITLGTTDDGATGVNQNADTKFANLLDITNQGTQPVNVYVEDDPADTEFGVFAEGPEGDGSYYPDDDDSDSQDGSGFDVDDPVTLNAGSTVQNIGIAWDGSPPDEGAYTLTFVAEAANGQQP